MRKSLLGLLVFWSFIGHTQPCGPADRNVDRQFIDPEGRVLLLTTRFDGTLMDMMSHDPNEFWFNFILINTDGRLVADKTLRIPFHGYHYDFYENCEASYGQFPKGFKLTPRTCDCALYDVFTVGDKIVVNYHAFNDPYFTYFIEIDPVGNAEWKERDLSQEISLFYDDFTKTVLIDALMDDLYPSREQFLKPHVDVPKDSILRVNLMQFEIDPQRGSRFSSYWKVSNDSWTLALDGILLDPCRPPLINFYKQTLVVTVFNQDQEECHGYGPDTWPLVYGVDIKTGEVQWKHLIDHPIPWGK